MILRPRQTLLVQRTLAALEAHGNTLAVAPTGSGKTIMLSAIAGNLLAEPDAEIGTALLDQRKLAGLGNLYRCEALFLRGLISPEFLR